MKMLVGAIVLSVAAWVAAPWASMARHGTVDSRVLTACRAEYAIPAPRLAPDDLATRDHSA